MERIEKGATAQVTAAIQDHPDGLCHCRKSQLRRADILRLSSTGLQCKGYKRAFDSKPDREEHAV